MNFLRYFVIFFWYEVFATLVGNFVIWIDSAPDGGCCVECCIDPLGIRSPHPIEFTQLFHSIVVFGMAIGIGNLAGPFALMIIWAFLDTLLTPDSGFPRS